MAANSGNAGGETQGPKPKPWHKCGEVGNYGRQKRKGRAKAHKNASKNSFERDHVPSKAAIVRRAMTKSFGPPKVMRKMSKKKAKCVHNRCRDRAQSIVIPARMHRLYSPTCGANNTEAQIDSDSADLDAARERDLDAMQKKMDGPRKNPCADAYRAAAEEIKQFDNDAMIKKALKDCKVR